MAKKLLFCALFLIGLVVSAEEKGAVQKITLARCFELALQNSEKIAISLEAIKKAESQYTQVLGKSLPELSFRFTSLWQDQSGLKDQGSVGGSFTNSPQPEALLRMKLPLFNGYRELAATKAGASLVRQRTKEKDHVRLLLFQDVAQSYYALLLAKENLNTFQKTLDLTQKRLKEIVAREAIGRSRKTEVIDSEAKIAQLQVEKEESKETYQTAKNLLEFLIGIPLEGELHHFSKALPQKNLGSYLNDAHTRPDMQAKKEAVLVAKGAFSSAKSEHWPGLDLNANYYLERTGLREPIDWDFNLGVTVPLWSWGAIQGKVKEARANFKSAQREKELLEKETELEIKDAFEKYSSSSKRVLLQEKALKLVRRSFELKSEEYQRNLINNLEVLDALDHLYQTELALNAIRFQNILNYLKLETSHGKIPEAFE